MTSYVSNATGITKLHFFLAENNGELKLIISGVDANGNHIYINDGNNNYFVFDHTLPCPECQQITNGGTSLE